MIKDDYTRPQPAPFPADLASMIARKASIMASRLEDQAIRSMVRDAQRGLDRGMRVEEIAKELQLPAQKTESVGKNRKS